MAGAHSQSKPSRGTSSPTGGRGWFVAVSLVTVAVVGAGVTLLAVRDNPGKAAASPTTSPDKMVLTSQSGPFRVISVSPADGTTQVPSDDTITVRLSAPVGQHSPTPTLSPAVAGSWVQATPETFAFVPDSPLVPSATETVTVPGGASGVTSADGKKLAVTTTARFTVAAGSTLRLQQLLAQLGYLPVSFTPAGPLSSPQEAAQAQEGTFAWRWNEPAALESQWTPGAAGPITTGAVMTFESQNGLTTDGEAGPTVWQALLADAVAAKGDPAPYDYVFVSEARPETASVYSDGAEVYSTLANTGVAGATTAVGTFPVYLRYRVTTMSGTNPDGSKYVDPGIPWVSYFHGGDALHGFVRGSYGFPQSDGCVEMPPAHAAVVWPLTPIGTLVTVS
jgi:peptidoglycan hydrolase-like protein with peptidoglycan-binding domain